MKLLNWYKNKNIENILFYLSWGLLMLAVLLTLTGWWLIDVCSPEPIFSIVTKFIKYFATFLACIVILFNLIQKKYSVKAIIGYGVMLIVFLLSAYFSKNTELVGYWFFFAAAYKKDTKKILLIAAVLMGLLLLMITVCSQIGLTEDVIFNQKAYDRHSLGFNYCTTAPILYFFFILNYILIRREKIKIWELAILEVINIFFFIMTHTQMAFYLGTIAIVFFAIQSLFKKHWKISQKIHWLWLVLPILIFAGTILIHVVFNYNSALMKWLNRFLHGRLALGKNAINTYGITALGQPITWMGYSTIGVDLGEIYNYVDSAYLQIMLEFGIATICLVVAIYIVAIYRAEKAKNYWAVFALLFAMLLSVTEPRLMTFVYNILPIMAVTNLDYEGFAFKREKK